MPIRFADKAGEDSIVDLWLISIIRLTGNVMRNNIPHRISSLSPLIV